MQFFRKSLDSDAFGYQLALLSQSAVSETDKVLSGALNRGSVLNEISILQAAGVRFNEVLNEREFTTIFGVAITALLGLPQIGRISEKLNAGMDRRLLEKFDNADEIAEYRHKIKTIVLQHDDGAALADSVSQEISALVISDSLIQDELSPRFLEEMQTLVASSFMGIHSIAADALKKSKLV